MNHTSVFADVINKFLTEPYASLLNGMIFGIPISNVNFSNQLKHVGLIHMVVLSGSNISLISGYMLKLTSMLSKKMSLVLSLLSIVFFMYFVGIQAPVLRAGIMNIITIVCFIYGRKNMAIYSLFFSAFVILAFYPRWITSLSFQLSFFATLGILLFSHDRNEKTHFIWENLKVTLSAELFTVPLIFFHFRQISFISPLSNLLVAWTVEPLMIYGLLSAFIGKIIPQVGYVLSLICYGLLYYFIVVVNLLSKIPFIFIQF